MLKIICLIIFTISAVAGRIAENKLVGLTNETFDRVTQNNNIFVTFIYDFEDHAKFIELLNEVKNVAIEAEDLDTRILKFGVFDCKKYIKKCRSLGISDRVEVRYYGKKNKWEDVASFLGQMVEEVNQEDDLISQLDKPGRLLVLFKVVYCPYCKDTLAEWTGVKQYFENSQYLKLYTIDCARRKPICHKFEVKSYPKIKFIHNSKNNGQTLFTFTGDRTKGNINKWAGEMLHATMK